MGSAEFVDIRPGPALIQYEPTVQGGALSPAFYRDSEARRLMALEQKGTMRRVLAVAGVCILSVSVGLLPAVLTSCAGTTAGRGPNPSGIYQFALEGLYLGSGTLSIDSTDGRCSGFADHPGSLGGIELVRCRLSDDGLSFTLRPATSSGLDIVVSAKIQGRTLGGRWSTRGRSGHFFAQSKSW